MCNFPDLNRFLLKPDLSGKAGADHVKAWLEYKDKSLEDDDGKKVTDPDSSDAAREFYGIMWDDFLKNTGFRLRPKVVSPDEDPEKYVQGDWMCSVATTLGKGLVLYVKKHPESKIKGQRNGVGGYETYAPALLEDIKKETNQQQYSEIWGDPCLQDFIRSAYTFANLIIVPDGFNFSRNCTTKDYWDKTLEKYFNNQESLQCETKKEDEIIIYDRGKQFHDLVKASRDNGGDELFLDEWFHNDKKSIKMLPNKKLTKLDWPDGWHALMQEMTDRIDNRRVQMQVRINELMKRKR